MELRFLGQLYTTDNGQIKNIPSEYTARFLGQTYIPYLPLQVKKLPLGLHKYRGVVY